MNNFISCSIGVLAYNEEANIGKLLNALLKQNLDKVIIDKIIVVSSACTDRTDDICEEYATKHDQIELIKEPERNGKSAAINKFIKATSSDILVIESADTIPASNVIELFVSAFEDNKVGMAGGRPVPENSEKSFIGYSVNMLWRLHHQMALISPKLGEMVGFRRVFESIPEESAVDEASIEAIIREKNLELKYIPEAIIHNKGPETLADFMSQRRRIAAGHLWLEEHQGYKVVSNSNKILFRLLCNEIKERPTRIFNLVGTMMIEIWCRFLGWHDYKVKGKNPFKWDIASTTKNLKLK